MRFFIWHGEDDTVFDQETTFELYDELFDKLGINKTIEVMHHEPGLTHKTSSTEMKHLMSFIDEKIDTQIDTDSYKEVKLTKNEIEIIQWN